MAIDGPLAAYTKAPDEIKKYVIDYDDWLDTGETILSVVFDGGGLSVDSSSIDTGGRVVIYFVSGGTDGETYQVTVTATTSSGQVKEDCLLFAVNDC